MVHSTTSFFAHHHLRAVHLHHEQRFTAVYYCAQAAEAEDPTAGKKGKAPGRRGGRQPKIAAA